MELGNIIGVYEFVTMDGDAPIEQVPQPEPATIEEPVAPVVEDPELVPAN